MCIMVYVASDEPLPTIPWIQGQPRFNVRTLAEWNTGFEVVRHFTKPTVYYLGSYQGCGCGFGDPSPEGRQSLLELRNYLAAAIKYSKTLELYSCWAGNEGSDKVHEEVIEIDAILEPGFRFEEDVLRSIESQPLDKARDE